MNISTFYGLNVGVSALGAAQQVEDVISNNIANANTPGYAQETATLSEYSAFPTVPAHDAQQINGQMGQGAQVASVTRDTSAFLNQQDRTNQGTLKMFDAHQQNLTQIEGILNEPSAQSMQNAIDQFFNSWQTLSTDPSNVAARQSVISQASTVTQTFQTITNELESTQSNLTGVVANQIGQLNTDAIQVAQLNSQIVSVEQRGQSPNQLLDQRSLLLDNMSGLANISYTEQGNGAVAINLGSATLVDSSGSHLYPPGMTYNPQTNAPIITSIAQLQPDLGQITSGSIAGNVASINDTSNVLGSLNSFLTQFANTINTQQQSGYGLPGATTPTPALFNAPSNDAAGNVVLSVNSSITPQTVAASDTQNDPGNNNNAIAMVNIQNQNQSSLQNGTFDQYIASIVSGIGVETASVNTSQSTAKALAQQSSNMRQSVSSVDINEQAAMMVQYQNSYSAAAKFIGVFDQMMQSLMSIVP